MPGFDSPGGQWSHLVRQRDGATTGMTPLKLVLASPATSGESLAAWLLLREAEAPFAEEEVQPGQVDSEARLRELVPAGQPPILLVDGIPVWGILPIAEFVAEHRPAFWPAEPAAKAQARSIAFELAAGFGEIRTFLPFDALHRYGPPGRVLPAVDRELARLVQVCLWCRERHHAQGPFLFGGFGVVDALAAPLIVALHGNQAMPTEPVVLGYAEALLALPAMAQWRQQLLPPVEEAAPPAPAQPAPEPAAQPPPPSPPIASRRPEPPPAPRPVLPEPVAARAEPPPRRIVPPPVPLPVREVVPPAAPPPRITPPIRATPDAAPVAVEPAPPPPPAERAVPEPPPPQDVVAPEPTPPRLPPRSDDGLGALAGIVPRRPSWLRRSPEMPTPPLPEPDLPRAPEPIPSPKRPRLAEDQGQGVRSPMIKPIGDGTRRRR